MKRIIALLLIAATLLGSPATVMAANPEPVQISAETDQISVTDLSKTSYTTARLNVRTGPSTDYSRIATLAYGTEIAVTGDCGNGWYRIDYQGMDAYVSAAYVSDTQPVIEEATAASVPGIAESYAGASRDWVDKVNQQLAYVPENVKARFVSEGWHIYITTENLAQTYFAGVYNSVQGVTDYAGKTIKIETRNAAVNGAVVHEMGHFVDYILGTPSMSSEFTQIYNEEVATFKSGITNSSAVRDPMEFFAETFEYMYKDPSKCTPKAKAFIEARVGLV